MILMQLNNIMKSYAGIPILNNVNIEVQSNNRIAIVGRNGAGKSTLLKIMTGETDYDEGDFFQIKDLHTGYLAQHNDLSSNKTIWEELLTVFVPLQNEAIAITELEQQIEKNGIDGIHDDKLLNEYSNRQEKFAENGGYRYESDTRGVLIGLGFLEADFGLFVNDLSGGQKTRLALGKLLLQKPALLILDEPTNHLDIATLSWLENYLVNYPGAIVVVSHDRYFLDKIVTKIYEIAHQKTIKYHSSYTKYLMQKAANHDQDVKAYEKQQEEIKTMEDFIQRNIARASTTKRAQSRRIQLEKLPKLDRPLGNESSASFSFQVAKTSGNDVALVNDFSFQHEGETKPLFSNVSFHVNKGERIVLIGENGIGKTTLLKAMLQGDKRIKLGANVQIGYYDQEQADVNAENTLLEEVWSHFPHKDEQEIRTVLGNFLFSGDDVLKFVHTLSGGEKARLALAKLMLLQANFLVLDEPTNHLDLTSKEILEKALQNYPGTILFVSHDRYFINKIAEKVFELKKEGLTTYLGDYDYYLEKKLEKAEIKKLEAKNNPVENETINTENLSFKEQKRVQSEQRKKEREISQIESEVEQLENKLSLTESQMTNPEIFNDHEVLLELTNETHAMQAQIDELLVKWEALH